MATLLSASLAGAGPTLGAAAQRAPPSSPQPPCPDADASLPSGSLAAYVALLAEASEANDEFRSEGFRLLGLRDAAFPEANDTVWEPPRTLVEALQRAETARFFAAHDMRPLDALGRRPRPVLEVLRSREADAGERHALFAALLSVAAPGMDPRPAFLGRRVLTLLSVEDTTIWVDIACPQAPFGYLAPELRDREATVVESDGRLRSVRTPARSAYGDVFAISLEGRIDADGVLEGRLRQKARGEFEWALRHAFRSVARDRWDELIRSLAAEQDLAGEVELHELRWPSSRNPFRLDYSVRAPGHILGGETEAFLRLPFGELPLPTPEVVEAGDEREGARLPPYYVVRRLDLRLPPDMTVRMPRDLSLERPFASYRSTYRLSEGRLRVRQSVLIRERSLPADRLDDWFAFLDALLADLRQVIQVTSRGVLAAEAVGDGDPREREARPLLEAARAALRRGELVAAAGDLERALEVLPGHTAARAMLAYVHLASERPVEALRILERLAEEEPFLPYVHWHHALALDAAGRAEEAAEVLALHLGLQPYDGAALAGEGPVRPLLYLSDCGFGCRAIHKPLPPRLANVREVQRLLQSHYPRRLRERGIGGRIQLWLLVDERGEVGSAEVRIGSGHAELDRAAQEIAIRMRFEPARADGEPVEVWISQWITFEIL